MSDESLLPPNATPLECAVEEVTTVPLRILNATLWNPEEVPAELLPWLAHSLSVDTWESDWAESTKREVIRASVQVHRIKGTRASIRAAIRAAGFGEVVIVEGASAVRYDGTKSHNGAVLYGSTALWAEYSVFLARPITLRQAAQVRRLLSRVAPVRCRLALLDYREAAILEDGSIRHNGTYSHGAA